MKKTILLSITALLLLFTYSMIQSRKNLHQSEHYAEGLALHKHRVATQTTNWKDVWYY
jgi:hypothetical protein